MDPADQIGNWSFVTANPLALERLNPSFGFRFSAFLSPLRRVGALWLVPYGVTSAWSWVGTKPLRRVFSVMQRASMKWRR